MHTSLKEKESQQLQQIMVKDNYNRSCLFLAPGSAPFLSNISVPPILIQMLQEKLRFSLHTTKSPPTPSNADTRSFTQRDMDVNV